MTLDALTSPPLFPPGRPRNVAVRQCDKYRGSVSAVTLPS